LTKYPNAEVNPTVKSYISFALKNPNLLGFTISNITWYLDNNDVSLRRQSLTNALTEFGLTLDDCENKIKRLAHGSNTIKIFCENGYPSLTESVALIRISLYLLKVSGSSGINSIIIIIIIIIIIVIIIIVIITIIIITIIIIIINRF